MEKLSKIKKATIPELVEILKEVPGLSYESEIERNSTEYKTVGEILWIIANSKYQIKTIQEYCEEHYDDYFADEIADELGAIQINYLEKL